MNRPVQPPLIRQGYCAPVEQYRGLCALLVLVAHGAAHEEMLIDNFKWPEYIHYLGAGYLSVIVFFCISGYVIAVSNDTVQLNIKKYLQKRMVRLYPVYIFSILLCIIIAGGVSVFVLTGNLLFLQNDNGYGWFKVPIFVNFATWSLNYEAVYYLLFIGLFFMRPKVWQLILGMVLLTVAILNVRPGIQFIALFINGSYFWILGLFIGWKIIDGSTIKEKSIPLLSLLFLQLCLHHLSLGAIILNTLGIVSNTNLNSLFNLPFCLMLLGILTQKHSAFLTFNKIITYTLPAFVFIYLVLNNRIFEDTRWVMCLIYWVLALLLHNEKRISSWLMQRLTGVGKISYAIYLVHVPVALLIKKLLFINYQPAEIAIKYLLWIAVTIGLSIFLDLFYQPFIKKRLISN